MDGIRPPPAPLTCLLPFVTSNEHRQVIYPGMRKYARSIPGHHLPKMPSCNYHTAIVIRSIRTLARATGLLGFLGFLGAGLGGVLSI